MATICGESGSYLMPFIAVLDPQCVDLLSSLHFDMLCPASDEGSKIYQA